MADRQSGINRRDFLRAAGGATALAAAGCATTGPRPQGGKRPNIVVVISDDHRADLMGCRGNPYIDTPNMDRLADEGCMFMNAFATSGVCSPSRASFLTGKHAHRCGSPGIVWTNNTFLSQETPFPARLHDAGYYTAHVGKWHIGHGDTRQPGYDYWAGFEFLGAPNDPTITINGVPRNYEGFLDDAIAGIAADVVRDAATRDQPFCLWVGLQSPHLPFAYPERLEHAFDDVDIPKPPTYDLDYAAAGKPAFMANNAIRIEDFQGGLPMFDNSWDQYIKSHYRSAQSLDESIGSILQALDETGAAEDTIVVYTSDQGYSLGELGLTEKHYAYEQVIRIPMLVRWPKGIAAGQRPEEMVCNIDLAPSLLSIAGVNPPDDMDGLSWAPLAMGTRRAAPWRDAFFFKQESPGAAIPGQIAVRTDRYKLITYQSFPDQELYDLEKDPLEARNVVDDPAYAEVRADLEARLEAMKDELGLVPWKIGPIDRAWVLGPMDAVNAEAAAHELGSADALKRPVEVANQTHGWRRVEAGDDGLLPLLEEPGAAGEAVVVAFPVQVAGHENPYTTLTFGPPPGPMTGYANGEPCWQTGPPMLNPLNPPLEPGGNVVAVVMDAEEPLRVRVNFTRQEPFVAVSLREPAS